MNNYAKNLVKNMKSFTHAENSHNGKFQFISASYNIRARFDPWSNFA